MLISIEINYDLLHSLTITCLTITYSFSMNDKKMNENKYTFLDIM